MKERTRFEREIMDLEVEREIPPKPQVTFPLPKVLRDGKYRFPEITNNAYGAGHHGVDIMYPWDSRLDPPKAELEKKKRLGKEKNEDGITVYGNYWAHEDFWVVAHAPGIIEQVFFDPKTPTNGWMVKILHLDNSHNSKYLHLACPIVKKGEPVKAGDPIAQLYNYKYPIHLHFEMRRQWPFVEKDHVDPAPFLANPLFIDLDTIISKASASKNLYQCLDIQKAITDNRKWAIEKGWQNFRPDIFRFLGLNTSASDELFIKAVAKWQRGNGIADEKVDVVIGPVTLGKMMPLLTKNGQRSSTTVQSTPKAPRRTVSGGSAQTSLKTIYNPVLIQWVQNSLNRLLLSNPPLDADGLLGKKTNPVLENFQRTFGISPIGEINERTLTEIENRNRGSLTVPSDTSGLRFKKWVQMALNLIYYRPSKKKCVFDHPGGLEVDGKFGDGTKSAIREFQARYPWELSATGSLDNNTIVKLFEVTAERPTKIDGSPLDIQVQVYEGMDWIDSKYTGNDILLPFLKGWVEQESDGKITSWTYLDERGYMQLIPEESENICIDHLRLSWDWNYSFAQGLVYIRNYMKLIDRLGFNKSTDLYWRMVKLCHWGVSAVERNVEKMKKNGYQLKDHDWTSFSQAILSNFPSSVKSGLDNVNKTFEKAQKYGYNL
jgi:hypothetical protein